MYRRRGERFATNWVLEADGNRGGSVIQHTARIFADHLANLGIAVCIEHLLDQLERRVRARQQPLTSLAELPRALQEEWVAIPEERVRRLTISMRRRCLAVMAANGGHTRY